VGGCGRWYVPSHVPSETVSEWAVGRSLTGGVDADAASRGSLLWYCMFGPSGSRAIGRWGFFCRTPRIRRPNGSGQHAAQIPSLDAKQEQQQEQLLLLLLLHETYSSYVANIRTTGRITPMKSFPPARSCAAWILHLSCRPASVSRKRKSRRLGRRPTALEPWRRGSYKRSLDRPRFVLP
jgi:hypothetical protein